jgi:hypothetical protein
MTEDANPHQDKRMGFWKVVGALAGAKLIHNRMNPPAITVPDKYEVISVKPSGMSEWKIKYRPKGGGSWKMMTIGRNYRSMSGGWEFHWD